MGGPEHGCSRLLRYGVYNARHAIRQRRSLRAGGDLGRAPLRISLRAGAKKKEKQKDLLAQFSLSLWPAAAATTAVVVVPLSMYVRVCASAVRASEPSSCEMPGTPSSCKADSGLRIFYVCGCLR